MEPPYPDTCLALVGLLGPSWRRRVVRVCVVFLLGEAPEGRKRPLSCIKSTVLHSLAVTA